MPKETASPAAKGSASEAEGLLSGQDWLRMRQVAGIGALAVVVLLVGWWLLGGRAGEAPATEEALAWYETFDGVALGDLSYLGPAHLGRAQALEKLGRTAEAAEAYERFLVLWEDADPALQPMVEKARERLKGITEEGALPAPQEQ